MTIKFYHVPKGSANRLKDTKPRRYTKYNDIKLIPFVILRVLVTSWPNTGPFSFPRPKGSRK